MTTVPLDLDALPAVARGLVDALRSEPGVVVVEPPRAGAGYWAGGPNAVRHDGAYWMAYRLRRPVTEGRGYANVIARSFDGEHFETVATVTAAQFNCASLERPAIVPLPGGGLRLYVSCSTPNSKHWWVEAIEARDPAALASGTRTMILPGDAATAWKDVVVSHTTDDGWQMWACRHPLDGGDDDADRMSTWYFESADGLHWNEIGLALAPDATGWDRRGRRVGGVAAIDGVWVMLYDGRDSAAENWEERTGIAVGARASEFAAIDMEPIGGAAGPASGLRYSSLLADQAGGLRVYYETTRPDGAHDLRTLYVPRPVSDSQSA